jgi:RimJ/RimL family protein N-acetyltransferase
MPHTAPPPPNGLPVLATPLVLRTERLILRPWRAEDRPPFAALNGDPRVMEHFPATLDRTASDALADRLAAEVDAWGWGRWAVEVTGGPGFIGFVGLAPAPAGVPFGPAIEVGWRLSAESWGRGYATEAARAALAVAFDRLGLDRVVSFTVPANARSRAVMARLGLIHDPAGGFDHPALPPGHPLRPHVLHALDRAAYRRSVAQSPPA